MNDRSRLSRKAVKRNEKTFLISIVGIIILLGFLVKFGIPLLFNMSLFVANIRGSSSEISKNKTKGFLAAPNFDPTFSATNSASVSLKGNALPKLTIKLYRNDELISDTASKDDGSFSFSDVRLSKGDNVFKAKAIDESKNESDFSPLQTISYKTDAPALSVDAPTDGQTFSKDQNDIKASGKTDQGVKVTVNDFWAIVDESGNFSYTLHLKNGDNQIKIVATDDAGNKTEVTRKVTYSP